MTTSIKIGDGGYIFKQVIGIILNSEKSVLVIRSMKNDETLANIAARLMAGKKGLLAGKGFAG